MSCISSIFSYYKVLNWHDEAYRQLLQEVPLSEVETFLQDFENEIWRRRSILAKYRERIRRGGNAKFWYRREFKCLEALHILMKRRKLAPILFAEKQMNYARGTATI